MFGLFPSNVFLVLLLPKVGTYYYAKSLKFKTIIAIQNRATLIELLGDTPILPVSDSLTRPYLRKKGMNESSYTRKEGVPVSLIIQELLLL